MGFAGMTRSLLRSRRFFITLGIVALAIGVLGFAAWYTLFRQVPTFYASPDEHFKYGSIGIEPTEGIPFLIWEAMPELCTDRLGAEGYASLGMIWEEGRDTPVGFSKKIVGFPRIAINCATCHAGTYRTAPNDDIHVVPAAPATRMDVQGYIRFVGACASDPEFTVDRVLDAIARKHSLSAFESLLYRLIIIPQTKQQLTAQRQAFVWMDSRPDWGRGRIDPFNPVKTRVLGLPIDDTIGNSDMEPIWNLNAREGTALHWDGMNTSVHEVVLSSAIGDGASRDTIDLDSLQRIEEWLRTLQPPTYPLSIDQTLAARGAEVYEQHCDECHTLGAALTGTVIALDMIGTDRHRLDMWTPLAAETYNAFAQGYPWDFNDFRTSQGYVAVALDGLWLRGPYLHNGSVPTVWDLLQPEDQRPTVFYRGYDVIDADNVGFTSEGAEAERVGFRFDTSLPGNSNRGHLYGVDLLDADKRALIEYLKTQ